MLKLISYFLIRKFFNKVNQRTNKKSYQILYFIYFNNLVIGPATEELALHITGPI